MADFHHFGQLKNETNHNYFPILVEPKTEETKIKIHSQNSIKSLLERDKKESKRVQLKTVNKTLEQGFQKIGNSSTKRAELDKMCGSTVHIHNTQSNKGDVKPEVENFNWIEIIAGLTITTLLVLIILIAICIICWYCQKRRQKKRANKANNAYGRQNYGMGMDPRMNMDPRMSMEMQNGFGNNNGQWLDPRILMMQNGNGGWDNHNQNGNGPWTDPRMVMNKNGKMVYGSGQVGAGNRHMGTGNQGHVVDGINMQGGNQRDIGLISSPDNPPPQ